VRLLDAIGRQIGVALSNARLYAEAVREEARVRTILQSVADGLLMFDSDGTLMLMNPTAKTWFSFYPKDCGGATHAASILWDWMQSHDPVPATVEFELPVTPLEPPDGPSIASRCVASPCRATPDEDAAWPCWLNGDDTDDARRRGCALYTQMRRRAIQAKSTPVRDASGEIQGTVIALHDVTHFHELDELKGRFVSTVSHELRTPLSTVLLQISTLLKYYDRFSDDERRMVIGEVQQQAYALRELIEDILELSRFDAKRAMPQRQWFDLLAQCRDVVEALDLAIREKHITLNTEQCQEPCYIVGDVNQLTRVVRNLVTNAVKYTPPGGQVSLRLEKIGDEVRLQVEDTGIGISPKDQALIFDRFYRTDEAVQMASGTGLGLAITKEIIDLHQGRIDLRSEPGKGSTFTIWLPVTTESEESDETERLL